MNVNAVRHLKVIWHHDFPDEPVEVLSEIGGDRYEVRKVEVYRDGRLDWAEESRRSPSIGLGEIPFPEPEEIDAMDDFSAMAITAEEFEQAWAVARAQDPDQSRTRAPDGSGGRQPGAGQGT